MGKTEYSITPMNSHLVMFDKPKMGIIESFLEEMHGIILSEYSFTDNNGKIQFGTNRTILVGEELNPKWSIDSYSDSTFIHFFKNFPVLSVYDVSQIIQSAKGVRGLGETFDDLLEAGCYIQTKGLVIDVRLNEYNTCDGTEYSFLIPNIAYFNTNEKWIPAALLKLFSIQKFMGCKFHLNSDDKLQAVANMMNELLDNHHRNGVMVVREKGDVICVNDGVYTYHTNGLKEPQTREKFLKKYTASNEYKD